MRHICLILTELQDSGNRVQAPFEACAEAGKFYPITESEPEEDNTYLTYNIVVGDSLDRKGISLSRFWIMLFAARRERL